MHIGTQEWTVESLAHSIHSKTDSFIHGMKHRVAVAMHYGIKLIAHLC